MNPNKQYKDSVFTKIFSDEEKLLELYSAISDKNYPPDTKIEINTLEDALFLDRNNDISFLVEDKLVVLIEAQSTINENMPLRCLIYLARIYEKIIDNKTIYRRKLVKIPTPEFVVLYNGTDPYPEHTTLNLSDAFIDNELDICLELIVNVYNINPGYNEGIKDKSKTLNDYTVFVTRVRENIQKRNMYLKEAIKEAVLYCIDNGVMYNFLKRHGSEVNNMLYTEFKLEDAQKVWREEGLEEGREEGLEEGREEGREEGKIEVAKSLLLLNIPIEQIVKATGFTRDRIMNL